MKGLTQAQLRALRWLYERGGTATLDRYGRAAAGGDRAPSIAPETWLRLMLSEDIRPAGGNAFVMTAAGLDALGIEA